MIGIGLALVHGSSAGKSFDWYVDSAAGSDSHTGKTPQQALQTIGALLGKTIIAGQRIGLKAGSVWREQLAFGTGLSSIAVAAYGSGAKPLLDCSDVISAGGWTKAGGYTSVYQSSLTLHGTLGNPWFMGLWENGTRLVRATSIANCDATPGSYFPPDEDIVTGHYPSLSTSVYIHASDGSSPASNGKTYEYSSRECGVSGGNNVNIAGLHTQRNLHCGGSIDVYTNAMVSNCVCSEGNKHNIYTGPGSTLNNVEADRAYYIGDALMFVHNGASLGNGNVTYNNCYAHDCGPAGGSGFGGHSNDTTTFGTITYNNCTVVNCTRGFDPGDTQAVQVIGCITTLPSAQDSTGAVWCDSRTSLLVDSCNLTGNSAHGRAVQLDAAGSGPVTVTIRNSTLGGASAFYSPQTVSLTLQNNTITTSGYALYLNGTGCSMTSTANTFTVYPYGTHFFFSNSAATVTSDNNTYVEPAVGGSYAQFETPSGTGYSYAGWQAAGQDTHSTVVRLADHYFDSVNGNDAHDGLSWVNAKQTFTWPSFLGVTSGQRLGLACGSTWTGGLTLSVGGSPMDNVNVLAYGSGAAPVLDTTASSGTAALYFAGTTLTLTGLDLKADRGTGWAVGLYHDASQAAASVTITGCTLNGHAAWYTNVDNVILTLRNSTIDTGSWGVYFVSAGNSFVASGNSYTVHGNYYYMQGTPGTISSDYNTFVAPSGTQFQIPDNLSDTLAQWQAGTGPCAAVGPQDTHSVTA